MSSKLYLFFLLGLLCIVELVTAQGTCQKHKEKEAKNTSPLKLDVKCKEGGEEYAELQCFPGNKFCYCALPDGTQVTQPSRNKKFCKCDLQKHQAEKKLTANGRPLDPAKGSYIPQCSRDGLYMQKQCETGTGICWCVNQEGAQTSKDKKADIKCT